MLRRAVVVAVLALIAVPAAGAAGKAKPLKFKLGTYSGAVGSGAAADKFTFKIYKGTCEKKRQYNIPTKGICFKVVSFPALSAACDDGTTKTDELYAYDTHMSNSGKYSDTAETSDTVNTTAVRKIKFALKGKKLTGTFVYKDTSFMSPKFLNCTSGTLKLSGAVG
jgi:hypothetical protein